MAVGVVAVPEVEDPAAPALVGGAGGETPLGAAGKEPPPVDGVPAIEVEGNGSEPPLEGAPMVVTVEREEEADKAEEMNKADAEAGTADGVPAVEEEGKGAPAFITVEGDEEAHKAEEKNEADAEAETADGVPAVEEEGKGAAPPLEGALAVMTVVGEEAHKAEDKKEAEAVAEEEEEEGDEGQKWLGHYSSGQRILIVGDGDFSFSLALATAFGSGSNLVATSLDTYEALRVKYSKAESNILELKRLGTTVLHGVDVKKMRFHKDLKNNRFDRIVFNLPHAGFKGKEDDMHMINSHKQLLWGYFSNACHLVWRYGEIHVTHKTGHPYDRWDLEHLASGSSLAMVEKVVFRKEDYPGYNQKRGDSARCDEPFDLGACCTFKFQIRDFKKLKKMNAKRAGSIPSLGGSNIHPGHRVTDRGLFHPLPPFAAWPWQHRPPPDNTDTMLMPLLPYIADQRPQPGFPPNSDGMVRAPYFHQHDSFHPMVGMPGPWPNALPDQGVIHQQDGFHPMANMPGLWPNALPCPDSINQHDRFHPVVSMPGPGPNALPDQGVIHRHDSFHPIVNMPGPWQNALPPPCSVPPPMGRPDLAPQDQHLCQQRPVPYQLGGDERSLQTENEMHGQVMPEATSLNRSAFLEHRHGDRESVEHLEWLRRMIALYGRR